MATIAQLTPFEAPDRAPDCARPEKNARVTRASFAERTFEPTGVLILPSECRAFEAGKPARCLPSRSRMGAMGREIPRRSADRRIDAVQVHVRRSRTGRKTGVGNLAEEGSGNVAVFCQVAHVRGSSGRPLLHQRRALPPGHVGKCNGAGDESRTRDLNLGKVALYQLSYSRITLLLAPRPGLEPGTYGLTVRRSTG
ncbi:protein of unknown function [Burkholderia multivorans]